MMTRDQQVSAAIKILDPQRKRAVAVREAVTDAIDEITFKCANASTTSRSKETRTKVRSLRAALKRSQGLVEDLAHNNALWHAVLVHRTTLPDLIALCDRELNEPARPARPSSYRQQLAVAYARGLVSSFGDEKDLAVSRKNAWHRLSAVLNGDPTIDLFNHMRKISRPDAGRK